MGVSLCSPDPGLKADGPRAGRPARWAQPSSADAAAPGPEAGLLLSAWGRVEPGAGEGKGSLCSLLLPPLCVCGRTGHWPGLFPCGVHRVFAFLEIQEINFNSFL